MSLQSLINTLRSDLRPDTQRGQLVRSAIGTAGLKVGATLIAFLASLFYARVLGPHNYGLYAYVMAWVAVLTIPASLGIPAYMIRESARRPDATGWLRHWADRRIWVSCIVAGVILAGAAFWSGVSAARWIFVVAIPIPLLANLSAIRQSIIQAQGQIIRSQWPQLIFAPCFTLVLLLPLWILRGEIRPLDLMAATALAALVQLAINIGQIGRWSDIHIHVHDTRISAALPFMWVGALYLLVSRIDLILLGTIQGPGAAGMYAVATRAAEFVPFFLTAANTATSPRISSLHHLNDHVRLQSMTTSVARRLLWITLPLALALVFAAQLLLNFFYGEAYTQGAQALRILALAQFFTVFSGPVGVLLNMTEHAAKSAKAFALAAALNVTLNILLIPTYGITGAAAATAISLVLCNGIRWYWVRHYLNIKPSAFGI